MTTEELEKRYGRSEDRTDVIGLGKWRLGETIECADGRPRVLVHIEFRNMAVDLLRFDDGSEKFSGEIKDFIKVNPEGEGQEA